MAKRVLRKKTTLRNTQIMHPAREWGIGLLVGTVICVASAGWSAQTYIQYRNTTVAETKTKEAEVVVYRESLVQASLSALKERSDMHTAFLSLSSRKEKDVEQGEVMGGETATSSPSSSDEESAVEKEDTATTSSSGIAPEELLGSE